MPRYNLNALGSDEFERLAQALLKKVIGNGTITFGAGRDGGREATFSGNAPYPSSTNRWSGEWIFQAKFHDTELLGTDKARRQVLTDLDAELDKIVNKYKIPCDNYILITNVPLTPTFKSGTIDKITNEVIPRYSEQIRNISVWGADDVNSFLAAHDSVRRSFLDFIVPGDLIASLLRKHHAEQGRVERTIRAYLQAVFTREQNAQLDQAGDVSDHPVKLQKVFFDLAAKPGDHRSSVGPAELMRSKAVNWNYSRSPAVNVVHFMLSEDCNRLVLVGGPGEGKSTLGQYLAQLHRGTLLQAVSDIALDDGYIPALPRIPFRVILKDYGQWIAQRPSTDPSQGTLDKYICDHIEAATSRRISTTELHDVLSENPVLLVLDGLDEVTDTALKKNLLEKITEFTDRCEKILEVDLQVLATTRPTGYSDQFDPRRYLHLRLHKLKAKQVADYVSRWCKAKDFDDVKSKRILDGVHECLADAQISLLATTPLQVTILALIISSGGTPPRQREALFNEYLEVIYKRETAKGKHIIQSEKELLIGLHKYVGYILHEDATQASSLSANLNAAEYRIHVARFLRYNDPYSPPEHREAELKAITTEAGERLVLIVEPVSGEFGFELRSIQEFFAACHLADTSLTTEQRHLRFDAISRSVHWRNVALFFAGRVGRNYPGETANFLEVLRDVDRDSPDRFVRRGSRLALELAADRAFGPNRRGQRSLLEQGVLALEADLTAQRLSDICDILQRLPQEDIRDHVITIIDQKIATLDPSLLKNFAFAADAVKAETSFRAACYRLSTDLSETSHEACLEITLSLGPRNVSSSFDLGAIVAQMHPELVAERLTEASWEHAVECLKVLEQLEYDPIQLRILAGSVISRHNGPGLNSIASETDEFPWQRTPWPAAEIDQAIVAAEVMGYVRNLPYQSAQPSFRRTGSFMAIVSRISGTLPSHIRNGQLPYNPQDATAAALALNQWTLHIWFGEVTEKSISRFVSFYEGARADAAVRGIARSYARFNLTPTLDLLISAAESQCVEIVVATALRFAGNSGLNLWMEKLSEAFHAVEAKSVEVHDEKARPLYRRPPSRRGIFAALDSVADGIVVEYLARDWPSHGEFSVRDSRIALKAVTEKIITTPRLNAIRSLCSNRSYSTQYRTTLLQLLDGVAEGRPDFDETLALIIPACLNAGIHVTDEALDAALGCVGSSARHGRFNDEFAVPILSSEAVERLLQIVTKRDFAADSTLGAAKLLECYISTFVISVESYHEQVPRPRFRGFADVHRELCLSFNPTLKDLGLELFMVRYPVSVQDFDILFAAATSAGDSDTAELIAAISRLSPPSTRLHFQWQKTLQRILEAGTLEPQAVAVIVHDLERLLSLSPQGLGERQRDLGLPLQPVYEL
ncbi:NACHT domain-containing protein [Micromonospora profundi]|uniref:NACHT domain-containing protein n=1 Tax=Micromonospora profundi TaxID=1420889 RepID=UPI00366760EC